MGVFLAVFCLGFFGIVFWLVFGGRGVGEVFLGEFWFHLGRFLKGCFVCLFAGVFVFCLAWVFFFLI